MNPFLKTSVSDNNGVSAQDIEDKAISIIDRSFKTLRSSTAAFNMLMKFKHVHSREAINSHLMKKFNDVLVQYCKEVPYVHLSSVTIFLYDLPKTQLKPFYFTFKRMDAPFFCRWNKPMKSLKR